MVEREKLEELLADESVLQRAAEAAMLENGCGYTINGLHCLCDDKLAAGLVDGYGHPLLQLRCECRAMATAALRALLAEAGTPT